jgi:hypothetical protein
MDLKDFVLQLQLTLKNQVIYIVLLLWMPNKRYNLFTFIQTYKIDACKRIDFFNLKSFLLQNYGKYKTFHVK